MHAIDYILIGAILAAVFLAVRHVRKNKGGCGCGCSGCDGKKKNCHKEDA